MSATRTFWPRTYVYACNHVTVRYISIKEATTKTDRAALKAPFLMPVRVSRECITCIRQKMIVNLDGKAKAVRAAFASLVHGMDDIVKDAGKKSSTTDAETDTLIKQAESWDDEPIQLDSLLSYHLCKGDDEKDVSLSQRIRKVRERLEQCTQSWAPKAKDKVGAEVEVEVEVEVDGDKDRLLEQSDFLPCTKEDDEEFEELTDLLPALKEGDHNRE